MEDASCWCNIFPFSNFSILNPEIYIDIGQTSLLEVLFQCGVILDIFHYMQHGVLLRRGGDTDRVVFEDFAQKKVVYVSATNFRNGV